MPAHEPAAASPGSDHRSPSMRDVLASCAAASAVSTPPADADAPPAEPSAGTPPPDRTAPADQRAEGRDEPAGRSGDDLPPDDREQDGTSGREPGGTTPGDGDRQRDAA